MARTHTAVGSDDESEDESSDDEDWSESDDESGSEGGGYDLDICPPGCDQQLYNNTCQLRERRLDIEEVNWCHVCWSCLLMGKPCPIWFVMLLLGFG